MEPHEERLVRVFQANHLIFNKLLALIVLVRGYPLPDSWCRMLQKYNNTN